ncbi:MAG: right-handed parallel beta-helix repeat-containing protein [Thiotrichaceae bacterium]
MGITLADYTTVQDLNFTGFDAAILLFSQKQQMKVLRNKINNSRVGVRGSGVSFIDISNNEMRNIYGEAITFWPATNANITNNLIENVGIYPAVKGSYNAIRFGSDKPEASIKNVIANNVIRNVGYSGIMFRVGSGKPGEESIIEKNVIERALAILADGGAIYLQDCNGNIIRSNLILNTYGNKDSWREGLGFQENTAFAFGIVLFLDNNNGNQLLNNTIINADDGIHSGIPIKNTVIKGNTLYNNRLYQLSMAMGTYSGTASLNYDVQNNILYAIDPGQWTLDQTKRDQKNWLFGTFDNNFYGNPYYNSASGSNIGIYGGVEFHRYQLNEPAGNLLYNFDWWKTETGQDKNSKTDAEKWTVIKIGDKLYDVAQQLSPNLISNSTFDTAAPWEVMAGVITQEKKTGMDGGALHFVNDYSDASARLNNGHAIAFEKDQYYQLSFSTMRDTNNIVRVGVFDRTSTKGYKPLGGRYIFPLDRNAKIILICLNWMS